MQRTTGDGEREGKDSWKVRRRGEKRERSESEEGKTKGKKKREGRKELR